MNQLHFDILDKDRRELLPLLSSLKNNFYLAGGTALALHIGHRRSIDFDFFTQSTFSPDQLFTTLKLALQGHELKITQSEINTLSILVDSTVKLSFFSYTYKLIENLLPTDYLNLASIIDIGCMKLSAITSRSTLKDYVDLYYILKNIPLQTLLTHAKEKYPQLDTNVILKSLVYFEDIQEEPLMFLPGKEVAISDLKQFLQNEVKKIA